jgi:hypothetical protein
MGSATSKLTITNSPDTWDATVTGGILKLTKGTGTHAGQSFVGTFSGEPNEPGLGGEGAPARLEMRHVRSVSAGGGALLPVGSTAPTLAGSRHAPEGATRSEGKHQKAGPSRGLASGDPSE